ncbi:hypothetical protein CN918_31585 [Priestia megaterium]|nr:hypothetical protein CN918_31585 [Priestia megaterium]
MIIDVLELLKKNDTIVHKHQQNYHWRNGYYLKIDPTRPFTEQLETMNQNEMYVVKNKVEEEYVHSNPDLVSWFFQKDIVSRVLKDNSNKTLDSGPKQFYSTHCLALISKEEKMLHPDYLGKVQSRIFDSYGPNQQITNAFTSGAKSFFNYEANSKRKEEMEKTFPDMTRYLESKTREHLLTLVVNYWNENFDALVAFAKEKVKPKTYIALFLDVDKLRPLLTEDDNIYQNTDFYVLENDWYIKLKIFSRNDYNVKEGELIKGLSPFDYTLNDKKPFFRERTRMLGVSYLMSLTEAVLVNDLRSFFESSKTETHSFTYNGFVKNGGDIEPMHYLFYEKYGDKSIVFAENNGRNVKNKLQIGVKNFIGAPYFDVYTITTREELEKTVLDVLFLIKKSDRFNWLTYEYDKSKLNRKLLLQMFEETKKAWFVYFQKADTRALISVLDRSAFLLLQEKANYAFVNSDKGWNRHHVHQFINLIIALKKWLKGEEFMTGMLEKDSQYRQTDEGVPTEITSQDEAFYYTGQLAYYLASHSKANKKDFTLLTNMVRAHTFTQIKRELLELFKLYEHAISMYNTRFKTLYAAVLNILPEDKATISNRQKELLMMGMFADNILYTKKKEEQADANE